MYQHGSIYDEYLGSGHAFGSYEAALELEDGSFDPMVPESEYWNHLSNMTGLLPSNSTGANYLRDPTGLLRLNSTRVNTFVA